ncbi:MAG: DUF2390 domain-containing protein [Pseudomonas sp.]
MSNPTRDLVSYVQWFYPLSGVEAVLLRLQDEQSLDVLLLLTACWLSDTGMQLSAEDWDDLCGIHLPWQREVVEPLRVARRAVAQRDREAPLYAQLKACEQAAEWYQLEVVGVFCEDRARAADSACEGLGLLQQCCVAQLGSISAEIRRDLAALLRLADLPTPE